MKRISLAVALAVIASLALAATAMANPPKTSFKRAKITVTKTTEGKAITDKNGWAQYIFDQDKPKKKRSSRCYGGCAEAWPPLLTKKKPVAKGDAKRKHIGVTKRRDGTKQVTYRGRPLYYYAHEPRAKFVGCHDVFLNGGFWYVIDKKGKRRP